MKFFYLLMAGLLVFSGTAGALEKPVDTFAARPTPSPSASSLAPVLNSCQSGCSRRNTDATKYCREEQADKLAECLKTAMTKFDTCVQACAGTL